MQSPSEAFTRGLVIIGVCIAPLVILYSRSTFEEDMYGGRFYYMASSLSIMIPNLSPGFSSYSSFKYNMGFCNHLPPFVSQL